MRVHLSAALFSQALLAGALLAGCDTGPKSSYGFTLPDGDAQVGKAVFASMNCQSCHAVNGVERPEDPYMSIVLGGKTTRIKSYGELVTSVINPSHKLAKGHPTDDISDNGESKMVNYNDVLTVSELIDLVAFLQAQYEFQMPPRSTYVPY